MEKKVGDGGKRLRSGIVERPVKETIRLREVHVYIETNPIDRVATDADLSDSRKQSK